MEYPEAKLSLFGSSVNGFEMKNSDLDISLSFGGISLFKKDKVTHIFQIYATFHFIKFFI